MKKLIVLILLFVFICTPLLYSEEYEYVFTEEELEEFLEYHIQEAVDKAVADMVRDHATEEALLQYSVDHFRSSLEATTEALSDAQIRLNRQPYFIVGTAIISATTSFLIARLVYK